MNNSINLKIPLDAENLKDAIKTLTHLLTMFGEAKPAPAANVQVNDGANTVKEDTPPPAPAATTATVITKDHTHKENGEAVITSITTGVDLDSSGLPWDGRIHSAGKTKLVKGNTWKNKRGLDPALVLQVEAELRQAMAAPAATTETTAAQAFAEPVTTIPVAETIPPLADTQVPPANVIPAPAPTTPPAPPADAVALTFPLIMAKVTNAMTLGTLTQEMITAAVGKLGLASITLLSARPDLIDAANAELFPNG